MKKVSLVCALLTFASSAFAEVVDWKVDPGHSQIGFMVRHLGISKVRGEFKDYNAVVKADKDTGKVTALEAVVQTTSVDTGIQKRDDHLRSEEFFDVAKYPEMKLKVKNMRWKENQFTAETDLTLHGVTKTVTFTGEQSGTQKVNFNAWQLRTAYTATAKINRKDFGLKYSQVMEGAALVGDEVTIELDVELYYALPTPPPVKS